MKTLNQILVAVAVVGAVSVAQAQYSVGPINITGATVGPSPGSQSAIGSGDGLAQGTAFYAGSTFPGGTLYGTTSFSVPTSVSDPNGATLSLAMNAIMVASATGPGAASPYFTLDGVSVATLTGNSPYNIAPGTATYDVTVTWQVNGVPANYPASDLAVFKLGLGATVANEPFGAPGSQTAVDYAYISAVPEPSQAIAGITLLGCGGLVFLGRRFIAKKA